MTALGTLLTTAFCRIPDHRAPAQTAARSHVAALPGTTCFRLDRIDDFAVEADRFRAEPGKTLRDFLKRGQTWTRGSGNNAARM
jgi:hypothetical protein